jgi:spore maturation protein CgeB
VKNINVNPKKPPKVTVVSPMYGGSYEMSFYAARGFSEAGFEARVYDSSVFLEGLKKRENDRAAKEAYALEVMRLAYDGVLKTQPDIVFCMAQAPINSDGLTALKKSGITTAFWFVEDFRTLTYWKNIFAVCDYFFVIQRGPFIEKINREKGNGFYLPAAAQVPPGKSSAGAIYRSKVSFAGAPYRNRVAVLSSLSELDISIYGEGWDTAAGPGLKKNVRIGGRRVTAEELRAIYSGSTVNINLYSSAFYDGIDPHRDFINPRAFEIPASGGFQLSDARDNMAEFYEPEREIELFSTTGELKDKIKYYTENPEKAAVIAKEGFIRTARDHTYRVRMARAMEIITQGARERDPV